MNAIANAIVFGIISILIFKIIYFEGRPPLHHTNQEEAVPIYKNSDLSLFNKAIEYVFPLIAPVGTLAKCPLYPPYDSKCMSTSRDATLRTSKLLWSWLTPWKRTHTETIVQIPRPNVNDLGEESSLEVRLLIPKHSSENDLQDSPLVLWLHGGGFVLGSAQDFYLPTFVHALYRNPLSKDIASSIIWASVEYRLAPEHPYPAAPEDCFLALEYLAEKFKVNGGIHIAGMSAGGTLAAGTVLRALKKNQEIEDDESESEGSSTASHKKNRIHIDSMLLDTPAFPMSGSKFTLDSQSVRRMMHTRTCPDQCRRWWMAAYAHCQPLEDVDNVENIPPLPPVKSGEEPLLPFCNDDEHSKIFDGTMSIDEWTNAASNGQQLPSLLLLTGKADPLHDGGVAFKDLYEQVIDNANAASVHVNNNNTNDGPIIRHVDARTSHVTMYVCGDSESIHAVTTEWTAKFLKKQKQHAD